MKKPIIIQFVVFSFISVIESDFHNLHFSRQSEIDKIPNVKLKKLLTDHLNKNYLIVLKIKRKDKDTNSDDLKKIARINYDVETKKKQLKDDLILKQHNARMKEITDFMKDHMMSTKYIYDEVKRIKRDRVVKDDLRNMVAYLERPENREEKAAVLNFFAKNKKIHKIKKINVWDQRTNDLVINVIKDPYNDGTIN